MFARLIDVMGDDLKIVNAARRSVQAPTSEHELMATRDEKDNLIHKESLKSVDAHLINYLARGLPSQEFEKLCEDLYKGEGSSIVDALNKYRSTAEHWTPFAHCAMTFHVQMPIFVARQLIRHTVGVTISEMSRRYVSKDPEYWFPEEGDWRLQADNVKQGSSDQCLTGEEAKTVNAKVGMFCSEATHLYRELVDDYKIAPEMARMILPINLYTDWHWTISLITAARICKQRLDAHAQKEIQLLAQQINDRAAKAFPVAWKALMSYGTAEITDEDRIIRD